ncbi:hypothetical protein [Microtetraspora sp. NBRC 13810]|uniref:hypothetical protein n=1 Tax=Microtetraspora sp. NBRC 13810 TaxID=3030990 RepID=UPI0025579527|nr:hypothetical protein [Microtetraspora sp. NBRC 13810]
MLDDSATALHALKGSSPEFEGWNLAPVGGIPLVGLPYVNRLNSVSRTWGDSAAILGDSLRSDGGTMVRAAENYDASEIANMTGVSRLQPLKGA